jgi:hypothetical protein
MASVQGFCGMSMLYACIGLVIIIRRDEQQSQAHIYGCAVVLSISRPIVSYPSFCVAEPPPT